MNTNLEENKLADDVVEAILVEETDSKKDEKSEKEEVKKVENETDGDVEVSADEKETETKKEVYTKKEVKENTSEKSEVVISENVKEMFAGLELSEDFKSKASLVFEATLVTKVNEELERLEEEAQEQIDERIQALDEHYAEKVDGYLSELATQWLEENKLSVEAGLRLELSENFMEDLRNLFERHNINVPAEKVDMVEELQTKLDEAKKEYEAVFENTISLKNEIFDLKKSKVLAELSEGLTLTQKEKLEKLSENVKAENIEQFQEGVETLKASYFAEDKKEEPTKELVAEEVLVEQDSSKLIAQAIAKNAGNFMRSKK